jgi:hypothetical protein
MHYSIVPVTLLYVGAIGTLGWLGAREIGIGSNGRRLRLARAAAVAMFAVSAATVPAWWVPAILRLNPHARELRAVTALVPDTASVTAPDYLLNQMARRPRIAKTWMGPLTTTSYVILQEPDSLGYSGIRQDTRYSKAAAETLRRAGYVAIHGRNGVHVWRRP